MSVYPHRANLIVVSEHATELFYSHWAANTLDRTLFWGPEHALAFVRAQRREEEGAAWINEVWAEGGALLDLPMVGGGENPLYDVPHRRVLLSLMAHVWRGSTLLRFEMRVPIALDVRKRIWDDAIRQVTAADR